MDGIIGGKGCVSWIGKDFFYLRFIGSKKYYFAVCNRHHFIHFLDATSHQLCKTFLDDWSVPVNVLIPNRQLIGYDRDVHYVGIPRRTSFDRSLTATLPYFSLFSLYFSPRFANHCPFHFFL
jgi:hypothetical protein